MFETILYGSPEISILIGLIIVLLSALFSPSASKSCFKITKTIVAISAFLTILFYNKCIFEQYVTSSSYTALSYTLTALCAYIWLSLASKGTILLKESSQTILCSLTLCILFVISIFIKAEHFGVLASSLLGLAFFQFLLLRLSKTSEELYHTGSRYAFAAFLLVALFCGAVYLLSFEHLGYKDAAELLLTAGPSVKMVAVVSIFCVFLFLIGAAPFHFWLADSLSPVVLPVGSYFTLVPVLAFWSVFFKLHIEFFSLSADNLNKMYFVFGIVSVVFGAIGANTSRFLRKIFAFIGLYHTGVLLLLMSGLTAETILENYVYLELYLILIFGIYICFYTFKINGSYVSNIGDLEGVASMRPYTSAAFLFCLISLGALPPFWGFVMQYVALSKLTSGYVIYLVLLGSLILLPVYLKIIQSMYVLPRKNSFDRIDTGLYIYLILYIFFVCALMVKPQILLSQADILSNIG